MFSYFLSRIIVELWNYIRRISRSSFRGVRNNNSFVDILSL